MYAEDCDRPDLASQIQTRDRFFANYQAQLLQLDNRDRFESLQLLNRILEFFQFKFDRVYLRYLRIEYRNSSFTRWSVKIEGKCIEILRTL